MLICQCIVLQMTDPPIVCRPMAQVAGRQFHEGGCAGNTADVVQRILLYTVSLDSVDRDHCKHGARRQCCSKEPASVTDHGRLTLPAPDQKIQTCWSLNAGLQEEQGRRYMQLVNLLPRLAQELLACPAGHAAFQPIFVRGQLRISGNDNVKISHTDFVSSR